MTIININKIFFMKFMHFKQNGPQFTINYPKNNLEGNNEEKDKTVAH